MYMIENDSRQMMVERCAAKTVIVFQPLFQKNKNKALKYLRIERCTSNSKEKCFSKPKLSHNS